MTEPIKHGTPSDYQKNNRILVSTLAAYGGREVPKGFDWLKQSCDKFGIELTIFGWGDMFVNMYDSKLEYVGYQIYQLRDLYDWVIHIDSADTLFLRELYGDLEDCVKGMWFCAERNCFPIEALRQPLMDKAPVWTSYKFPNAGGFIGDMKTVVKTFAYMHYKRVLLNGTPEMTDGTCTTLNDDQAAWCLEALNGYVGIDYDCLVFQSLWGG